MKLPGAERAVVDPAKVRDYLLSPEHPVGRAKAKFFVKAGFDRANWTALQDQLLRLATQDAELGETTRFGQKFIIRGTIEAPALGRITLVAVWIVLKGEDFPRFVTAHPGAKS